MTTLRPYPHYRDSNIPFVGDIPEHWGTFRLRFLIHEIDERSDTGKEEQLSVSHLTGVSPRSEKNITMFKAASYVGHKRCREHDLVVNTMWTWMGALGVAGQSGIVSPSYAVYRIISDQRISPRFLDRLVRANPYIVEYHRQSTGIRSSRLRLYPDQFLNVTIGLPPRTEQESITAFLDAMDARITRFIAARRRLIALRVEQKQAVITQAVTRGLDPDVPLRDSGIPWLGQIPAHWEMPALRQLGTKFGSGVTPRGGATRYVQNGVLFLRSQNVHFEGLRLEDVAHITDEDDTQMEGSRVRSNDVLLNITGASLGRTCVVPEGIGRANVNQHVCIIRPIQPKVVPSFLSAFLSSAPAQLMIQQLSTGAAREGLAMDELKSICIPLPPTSEQEGIVERLTYQMSIIDAAIDRARREIELLREYRTRLISDVVTGKLDVRGVELPAIDDLDDADLALVDEAEDGETSKDHMDGDEEDEV